MKILLDEKIDRRLKPKIPGHDVFSTYEKGWNGLKNGALLSAMIADGFEVLISCDKNLPHQQNLEKHGIPVLILDAVDNRLATLIQFVPAILSAWRQNLKPGAIVLQP